MSNFICGSIVALLISLVFELMSILFLFSGNDLGVILTYSASGIIVYGIYVIIDLYTIANRLEVDDYILGALTLYIDLISLFLHILRIFGSKK